MLILFIFFLLTLSFGDALILIYHRFGEDKYPSTSVSLEDFEKQMKYLKENNYNVIRLSELVELLKEGKEIPDKTVVITIDDGYKSTMRAFEILKKYNFPFTVFLYMEAIGRYPDFLTPEDIEKLKEYGAEFGNHSYSHKNFGFIEDEEEFLEDLEKSERRFFEIFKEKPKFYAFPYGTYNRKIVKILKGRGYEALFTQDPTAVNEHTDLYLIPRQPVVGSWSRFENFKRNLNKEFLPVEKIFPEYGVLKKNPPEEAGVLLKFPERYENCEIYISELGWVKTERKGKKVFSKDIPKLKRSMNRIGVRCRNKETKRNAYIFWLIINKR